MSGRRRDTVFQCRMCGQCCEGRGGIVASPGDIARLADFLHLAPEVLVDVYAEKSGGKIKIRNGCSGCCIFFQEGKGCTVHEAKPAVCRAWPFFRGNIVDSESLALAKNFCPGIMPDITHDEFVSVGRAYLTEHGLLATDPACEANTLILP